MKDAYFQPNQLINELSMLKGDPGYVLEKGVNKNIKSVMMIEVSDNGEKNQTPSYPKNGWHGDYLSYSGQKSKSHYVSKVDLKQ